MYYFVIKNMAMRLFFQDLFIICCRHVTLVESTVYNDCIIYVILLFTLRPNVTCFY